MRRSFIQEKQIYYLYRLNNGEYINSTCIIIRHILNSKPYFTISQITCDNIANLPDPRYFSHTQTDRQTDATNNILPDTPVSNNTCPST